MFTPYHETKDGFEEQWAVNYLSNFLLTSLLLPLLTAGGRPDDCSRIVNVTSCAYMLGSTNFEDINCKYVNKRIAYLYICLMLIRSGVVVAFFCHEYLTASGTNL